MIHPATEPVPEAAEIAAAYRDWATAEMIAEVCREIQDRRRLHAFWQSALSPHGFGVVDYCWNRKPGR